MFESTLSRYSMLTLLALAACASSDAGTGAVRAPDSSGWRLSTGKLPSQAEFAALSATCEAVKGGATEVCLTDLGLKRVR